MLYLISWQRRCFSVSGGNKHSILVSYTLWGCIAPWVLVYRLNVFTLWAVICLSLQCLWKQHFNKLFAISKPPCPPTKGKLHLKKIPGKHTNKPKCRTCKHTQTLLCYFQLVNAQYHHTSHKLKFCEWPSKPKLIQFQILPHMCASGPALFTSEVSHLKILCEEQIKTSPLKKFSETPIAVQWHTMCVCRHSQATRGEIIYDSR